MLKQIKMNKLKGQYHSRKDVDVLIEQGIAFIAGDNKHQYIYEIHYDEPNKLIDYSIYKNGRNIDGGQIDDMLRPHKKFTIGDLLRMDPFIYSKKGNDFIKLLDYEEALETIDEYHEMFLKECKGEI